MFFERVFRRIDGFWVGTDKGCYAGLCCRLNYAPAAQRRAEVRRTERQELALYVAGLALSILCLLTIANRRAVGRPGDAWRPAALIPRIRCTRRRADEADFDTCVTDVCFRLLGIAL